MTSMRWRSVLVAVLLLASGAEFCARGPVRAVREMAWNDFLPLYIQSRAWAYGKDPYSAQSFISQWPSGNRRPAWVDSDTANGVLELKRGMPPPYPPSSLVVLSPFSMLPWAVAEPLWIVISIAAVVLSPFAFLSICGCSLAELRAQLFLAAAFALAPLHTGLATAHLTMLTISLTVFTVWAARFGRGKTAGVLLATAVCLKPTVAGGLLLFYLVRRRWKVAGIACAAAAMIGVLGASRLTIAGVPWLASYFENIRRIFASGSLTDFAQKDAIRFNLINAQVFFYSLLGNVSVADRLAQLLGTAFLGSWLWLCWRRRAASELLEISAIAVISLIPAYHRFYDAGLLIWPLAWSLLLAGKRSTVAITLAAIVPFLVPGPVLLTELVRTGWIPAAVANGWWWNAIVLSHEAWDLILLAVLLLYFMARGSSERGSSERSLPDSQALA